MSAILVQFDGNNTYFCHLYLSRFLLGQICVEDILANERRRSTRSEESGRRSVSNVKFDHRLNRCI